ncbi:response regulator [Nitrospina sp. 32_T5]|uniref:response regulator n=1 Tax=unclassified Nitrospina TaxID=2638683 RepID=UPI003F9D8417
MPKGKVLIVDDEKDVRDVLKFHLSEGHYQVIEAENGQEGIDLLNSEDNMSNVGVILCDIRMPKVNGIECIHYIRENAPGIPIVVITGFPDTKMAVDLLKEGVKDYLVKPVEQEKLVATVDKWVSVGKEIEL